MLCEDGAEVDQNYSKLLEEIDAFYEVLEMLEKASDALVSKIKNAQ